MPAVGSILTVNPTASSYVDDFPYVRSGTVTTFTNNTITLDAGASANSGEYVGCYVWIEGATTGGEGQFINPVVTAYNGNTKVASIGRWNGSSFSASDPAVNQWGAGDPAAGLTWRLIKDYPVIKTFSWMKDGVDIPDSDGPSFTPSVAGSYQIKEVARRYANDLTPGPATTTISAPIVITGTRATNLVYKDDLTYLGAFGAPGLLDPSNKGAEFGGAIGFNPAGNGGAGSLFIRGHVYNQLVTEISIPPQNTWATTDAASIPSGTALQGAWFDPLEGQKFTSGVAGAGDQIIGGLSVHDGKLIVTLHNSYAANTPASWFWRRPLNLATTGQLEGPFAVGDSSSGKGPRCFAGYTALIPPTLQSQLGGPMLCGLATQSIVSSTSDGPAIASFDPASFGAVSARRGTVTSATATKLVLDANASSTPEFYKGYFVTNASGLSGIATVTGYNATTKEATLSGWSAPAVGDTWVLIPPISAKAMAMYSDGQLQNSVDWQYQGVFNWNSRGIAGAVVPNSTKSVLVFGGSGRGLFQYAISTVSKGKARYFSNTISTDTPGEKSWPYGSRVWAYNADELEQVKLGNLSLGGIKPYAVWNFSAPFKSSPWPSSVTYDPANKRIIVAMTFGLGAYPIFHVWQITGSSATAG